MRKILSLAVIVLMCLNICACNDNQGEKNLWKNAMYTEDTEFGHGTISVYVEVKAEDKSVTFKINTDKKILGEALVEHKLIAGEKAAYGIYIKEVNGMRADYDEDKTYWSFTKNNESMMTGVDGVEIKDGEHYELVHQKG